MRNRHFLAGLSFLLAVFLLGSCSQQNPPPLRSQATAALASGKPQTPGFTLVADKPDPSVRLVLPSDAFQYQGRFDMSDLAAPAIIWQGSRIRVDFQGRKLAIRFDSLEGQSFFDVRLDDSECLLSITNKGPQRFVFQPALGNGRHSLTLAKRSEAAAGSVRFRGIEVEAESKVWRPAPRAYALAMEFFGDSITVGACNEDGDIDQWGDRSTHNNAKSYGALTAARFSVDYRNIAVSGMGVVTGWVDIRAEQIWERLYPKASSPRADLTAWQPDVVFVNLGENDDSFSTAKSQPFPPTFADAYVALVTSIRKEYPRAWIVLLRGGMYGGSQSPALRVAWETAAAKLEAADPAIRHFVFKHWSRMHPRVIDHQAMADELIAWLGKQDFMRSSAASP